MNRFDSPLDNALRRLCEHARLLPAVTADNALEERRRLVRVVEGGGRPEPEWRHTARKIGPDVDQWLKRARAWAADSPASRLYGAKLDELELDISLLRAIGSGAGVRPLSRQRFGSGDEIVSTARGEMSLRDIAHDLLDVTEPTPEPRTIPADAASGEVSLASMMRAMAKAAGLCVEVRVEPRLAAAAATGDRVIFIGPRPIGQREAIRLCVHEVLGHLVSAANGRSQALRVLEVGTAGSFADQEGVALYLESEAGTLDGSRLRTLAARVVVTDSMHSGATFAEAVENLQKVHGFCPYDAVVLAERAYRGGGIGRDIGYLRGFLRVRRAISQDETSIDELRMGRIGVADVEALRSLAKAGLVRRPVYRPSLARSLWATSCGTSPETSPPRRAASLTMLELT